MNWKKGMTACMTAVLFAASLSGNVGASGGIILKTDQAIEKSEMPEFSGTIWIAGDSIASDHSDNAEGYARPLVGWGEVIGDYLDDVEVHNEARSGRSSKSYINEKNYKTIMEGLKEGDVFLIQFGHNDENESVKLHTDPAGATTEEESYKWYLSTYYIEPALEAGAQPVLLTSVARYLDENGKLAEQTHGAYAEAMKELASEYNRDKGVTIPVIDCHAYTKELYEKDLAGGEAYHAYQGEEGSGELDTTHYCEFGARNMALHILTEACQLNLPFKGNVTEPMVSGGKVYEDCLEKKADLFDWRVSVK